MDSLEAKTIFIATWPAKPASWGFDADATAVWAILDHSSDFAAIPEPGTFKLFASLGVIALLIRRRLAGR